MTISARQIVVAPGAKGDRAEGVWLLAVDDPQRIVEVTLIPNGDHADDKWLAVTVDKALDRRVSGSGATPAHALAEIVWSVAMWRAGKMPCMAVTGDPRIVPPAPVVMPLEVQAGDQVAATQELSCGLPPAVDARGSTPRPASTAARTGRAAKLAALAEAHKTKKGT